MGYYNNALQYLNGEQGTYYRLVHNGVVSRLGWHTCGDISCQRVASIHSAAWKETTRKRDEAHLEYLLQNPQGLTLRESRKYLQNLQNRQAAQQGRPAQRQRVQALVPEHSVAVEPVKLK